MSSRRQVGITHTVQQRNGNNKNIVKSHQFCSDYFPVNYNGQIFIMIILLAACQTRLSRWVPFIKARSDMRVLYVTTTTPRRPCPAPNLVLCINTAPAILQKYSKRRHGVGSTVIKYWLK